MRIEITIPPVLMENPDRLAARAEDIFISELGALWLKYLLPSFRKTTPYRSGQLRRALFIARDGNRLILGVRNSGFYWHLATTACRSATKQFIKQLLPQMVDLALIRTREKIGL